MNASKPIQFLLTFILMLTLLCGAYVYLFSLQVGSPVRAESWIKSVLDYKDYYAKQITKPKLILSSGSNTLFGINSDKLEQQLNIPVVNLSAHAELTLDFLHRQLEQHVSKDDIVVMPLEFEYYFRDKNALSFWFVTNMLAWGKEVYIDKLPILEYLSFVANTPKSRVLEGLYLRDLKRELPDLNLIISRLKVMHNKKRYVDKGYSYLSLTKQGDMLPAKGPTPLVYDIYSKGTEDYQSTQYDMNPNFFKQFIKLQRMIAKRGAKLVLTWPVSIKNPSFDLTTIKHQAYISRLTNSLEKEGIQIECAPGLFNINYKFFLDTKYHLNAAGAALRTEILGNCLADVLGGIRKEFTFESSRKMLDAFEAKYDYGPSGY